MTKPLIPICLLATIMLTFPSIAGASNSMQISPSQQHQLAATQSTHTLGVIDMAQLRRQFPIKPGQPIQFATAQPVAIGLEAGEWTKLPGGRALWRLRLEAPTALSLNATFAKLTLPDSARLHLVDGAGHTVGPAVTADHVNSKGRFYSALVDGQSLTLELDVDQRERNLVGLQIERINQGFRSVLGNSLSNSLSMDSDLSTRAGGCNIDISCPVADEWQDVAASVARYTFDSQRGSSFCTGQMIAAADGVEIPYFLTANHCFSNALGAESIVFYFNYRSEQCRAPIGGQRGNLPANDLADIHYGGSELIATNPRSDFTLVRLNDEPPLSYNLFFTGWDRRDQNHEGGVHAIHHPGGSEKRYSFTSLTAHRSNYGNNNELNTGTHLRVPRWELGTTEGGSSGSGLWNSQQRLIGQLHGGSASCQATSSPDWYGRLAVSWDGETPQTRLKDWLDPQDDQPEALDGVPACVQPEVEIDRVNRFSDNSATQAITGDTIRFSAAASGGAGGPYQVAWDTNGDGTFDLNGPTIDLRFDRAGSVNLTAQVSDAQSCSTTLRFNQTIRAAQLDVEAGGEAVSLNTGSDAIQPGSRWRLPVQVTNTSDVALQAGAVSFSNLAVSDHDSGYLVIDGNQNGCDYNWISAGSGATDLTLTVSPELSDFGANDEGISQAIALRSGFELFDESISQLYLSSNGYLTSAASDFGDDFSNDCPLPATPDRGEGARLMPYHDDLITNDAWQQSFETCPRPAQAGAASQGCTVITWQQAEFFDSDAPPFAMQTIVYEDSGQITYQYQASSASRGGGASIGFQNALASQAVSLSCDQTSLNEGSNAVCMIPASNARAQLIIETPSVALPTELAPGDSVTIDVLFQVPENAPCGAGVALFAEEWAGRSSQGDTNGDAVFTGNVADNCAAVSSAGAPSFEPRAGLWWNPERAGNGMDFYQIANSNQAVILWYTADANRQPTWYLAQGPLENARMQAELRRFTWNGGGASDEAIGSLRLDFIDSENGLLRWQIGDERGSERVEAFLFGVGPGSENNTGLWFDPLESGWGMTFNNQTNAAGDDIETAIVYFYDIEGQPVWMLGQSEIGNTSTPMQQFSVSCPQCPWAASTSDSGGSVERDFNSETEGSVDVDLLLRNPRQGVWQRDTEIQRLTVPLEP